jgi:hypothetical protein
VERLDIGSGFQANRAEHGRHGDDRQSVQERDGTHMAQRAAVAPVLLALGNESRGLGGNYQAQ